MMPRTIGVICLGPSGNKQGGHYFMSLLMGRCLLCDRWTELPMPHDAVTRVGRMGRTQGMPKSLTFADRYGFELVDVADDVDDDHDSDFDPADADDAISYSSTDDNSSNDDSDPGDDFSQPLPDLPTGVNYDYDYDQNHDDQQDHGDNESHHSNDETNHSDNSKVETHDHSGVDEDDDKDDSDEEDDYNNNMRNDNDDDNNALQARTEPRLSPL